LYPISLRQILILLSHLRLGLRFAYSFEVFLPKALSTTKLRSSTESWTASDW